MLHSLEPTFLLSFLKTQLHSFFIMLKKTMQFGDQELLVNTVFDKYYYFNHSLQQSLK